MNRFVYCLVILNGAVAVAARALTAAATDGLDVTFLVGESASSTDAVARNTTETKWVHMLDSTCVMETKSVCEVYRNAIDSIESFEDECFYVYDKALSSLIVLAESSGCQTYY